MVKKQQFVKYKKAPEAPRRFKSAYMFFSTIKHKEIRENVGKNKPTTEIAKLVSVAWKSLPPKEREEWDEMARRDKARYEVEKSMYTGPWKIPAKQRAQKDPSAPKRPMSAFLSFSNSKRATVKQQNLGSSNAEVSRMLAKMWKEAPEDERNLHINRERELRQTYKIAIAIWREKVNTKLEDQRQKREEMALRAVDGISEAGDYSQTGGVANAADTADTVAQHGYGPGTSDTRGERSEYSHHPSHYEQGLKKNEDGAEHFERQIHTSNTSAVMARTTNTHAAHASNASLAGGMIPMGSAYPSSYPYTQPYLPNPYGGHNAHQPYYGIYNAGAPYVEQAGVGPRSGTATATEIVSGMEGGPRLDGNHSYSAATQLGGYSYPARTGHPPSQGSAYYQGFSQRPLEANGANTNSLPQYFDNHNDYLHHQPATTVTGNDEVAPYYNQSMLSKDPTNTLPHSGYPRGPY